MESLSVGYGRKVTIKDISLSLKQGEICTLIGPNGAGKSTILKTMLRFLSPMGGVIYLSDREVSGYSHAEMSRMMSAVLTERREMELMTCRDVVEAGRYPFTGRLGMLNDEDRRIADEAIKDMNVTALSERDFNACSDGEKQRVLIARALCQQPSLLVLDEPTSYLDIRYKLDLMEVLRKKASEGMTVLMSLHEIELALTLSDRLLCVRDGDVFFTGHPEEFAKGDYLQRLYDLSAGECEAVFGDILQRVVGNH